MLTGSAVLIVIFLFFIYFIFVKRDMLVKMFTLNVSSSSNELQEQLNKTADAIIKRLETEISHLEYLLEEAEAKSALLEKQLHAAADLLANADFSHYAKLQEDTKLDVSSEANIAHTFSATDNTPAKDVQNAEKRGLVVAMAEQGYSIIEIAKATGLGKGEVMLLLHLHRK